MQRLVNLSASVEQLVEFALLALRDTLPAEDNLTKKVSGRSYFDFIKRKHSNLYFGHLGSNLVCFFDEQIRLAIRTLKITQFFE